MSKNRTNNPIKKRALQRKSKALHRVMNISASDKLSTQLDKKNSIDQQIAKHQNKSKSRMQQESYQLANKAHAINVPEVSGLYHNRDYSLNDLAYFFAKFETEKPNITSVQQLSQEKQAVYYNRHTGKRGRNLMTNKPIEGKNDSKDYLKTSPPLKEQSITMRLIRGEAATANVDYYTNITLGPSNHYINKLHAHVINKLDPSFRRSGGKIHLIRPARDYYSSDATLNFLTFCTQTEMALSLNHLEKQDAINTGRKILEFTDYKTCITLSRTTRTEATPIGRLVQQAYFASDQVAPGDQLIIVDDHVQAGGSVLAMAASLKATGANILGVVTLTAHPYCRYGFKLEPKVLTHMNNVLAKWDTEGKVLEALSKFGLTSNTLTNAEAMIIIAYATDPVVKNNEINSIDKFQEINNFFMKNIKVLEGEHDSLLSVVQQSPDSPAAVVKNIEQCAKETRKTVSANRIMRAIVLDWNNFIVNEKKMNYQLMINAIYVAAHNYLDDDKHPDIAKIATALRPYLDGQGYREGMPKLCMGKENFTKYAIGTFSFTKKDMTNNLIQNLSAIAPNIKLNKDKKDKITNILDTEFNRQYKSFTDPVAAYSPNKKSSKPVENIDVPFKDITLEYMPGAKDFLDKKRKSENLLMLISNKNDYDLHNEVNKLGIAHYFDSISGTSRQTVFNKETKKYTIEVLHKKPLSNRLDEAIDNNSLKHRKVQYTLYGDQPKDIIQGEGLAVKNSTPRRKTRRAVSLSHVDRLTDTAQAQGSVVNQNRQRRKEYQPVTGVIVNPAMSPLDHPQNEGAVPVRYRKKL